MSFLYRGKDISNAAIPEERSAALKIQMIFQDPFASLNPRMRVRDIVGEAPKIHGLLDGRSHDDYVASMLEKVGLVVSYASRYPPSVFRRAATIPGGGPCFGSPTGVSCL